MPLARTSFALSVVAALSAATFAAPAAAQPYVYILGQTDTAPGSTNAGPQHVTVVDAATRTKVARITAGTGCLCVGAEGLTLSRDGSELYVANEVENSVTVISTVSRTVVATMANAISGSANFAGPIGVEVSPDDTKLYVLSNSGAVEIFDRAGRTRLATVPLGVVQTRGLAVTPDGARLYVSTYGSQSVKVVDLTSNAVVATIPLTGNALPLTVDVTPDGRWVYVAAPFTNAVAVIDTQTNTLATTIGLAARAFSLAVSPDGSVVHAPTSGGVVRISTATRTIAGTVTGIVATPVDFTPDGTRAWVASSASLTAIDTTTNTIAGPAVTWDLAADGQVAALVVGDASTAPPPVPPPTNFSATVAGNVVTLAWTPPAGSSPSRYDLEGGTTPGGVLATVPIGGSASSFSLNAPTGAFYLRLHAVAGSRRSAASNEVQIFVNVPRAPSAPTGLLGLVDGSAVAFAWQNTSGGGTPTSILLDVSGAIAATVPLGLGDTFTYPSMPPGTYTFAVRAANAAGASAASAPVTLTFPGGCSGAPNAPARLVWGRTATTLTIGWDLPASGPAPTSYVLQVRGAIDADVPLTQRLIGGSVPAGTYNLSVVAVNACGASAPTPVQSVTVP